MEAPQPQGTDQTTFNNELRGALFRNDKGDNPRRPDYRGRCTIGGQDYKISGWTREAVSDKRVFLSLAFTPDTGTESNATENPPPPF